MNKEIYNDGINWISYHETPNGRLSISDYPQSHLHGGGPKRTRIVEIEEKKRDALIDHLLTIKRHSKKVSENWKKTRGKIRFPFEYLEAIHEGQDPKEVINRTERNYGWSFIPDDWGEEIESSFWKTTKILKE